MNNEVPRRIWGWKTAVVLFAIYVVIWIPLEGNLAQTVLLGAWAALVGVAYLAQERLGGRSWGWWQWLGLLALLGASAGLGSGLLTLVSMVMKTGLHDHGPEFSRAEIEWVVQQIPIWTAVGGLAGIGLGLLTGKKGS